MIDDEEKLTKEYADERIPIPRPEKWSNCFYSTFLSLAFSLINLFFLRRGGYIVIPEAFEFWQGQSTRIHDRIRFRRPVSSEEPDGVLTHQGDQGWIYERLAP